VLSSTLLYYIVQTLRHAITDRSIGIVDNRAIVISVHVTRLDLVCHLPPSTPLPLPLPSSQPLGAITSLVHYFSHDSAFNWVLAVCSSDGRTHKILRPLVPPSVFNWTVTGFVQGTKTNGPGPGQFRDVVRPRRVNLKAESQVVRVYTRVCRARVYVHNENDEKKEKKKRKRERGKNNCQTFICIVLLWIRTRRYIYLSYLLRV